MLWLTFLLAGIVFSNVPCFIIAGLLALVSTQRRQARSDAFVAELKKANLNRRRQVR
jgi:uncharacterized membrane protein YqgA involved in biofilm formation